MSWTQWQHQGPAGTVPAKQVQQQTPLVANSIMQVKVYGRLGEAFNTYIGTEHIASDARC